MTTGEICYLGMSELAALYRTRQLSPVEVTRRMLARIEAIDPKLNAYARTTPERALKAAAAAEERIRKGETRSPLLGVPIAVKDNFDTAGVTTTNGMNLHRERIPTQDATAVRRLEDAGAGLLGKLQQTEGAFAEHHKTNRVPVNPWDAAYWAGASSSGSGVAPAAGLTFASLGSDTGGSVRFPCAANNLTGIKPTWGRVSRHGVYPNSPSMDHVGPMARSVEDVAIVLEAMAGADPLDPSASHLAVPCYLRNPRKSIDRLRVGIDPSFAFNGTSDEIAAALRRAMASLAEIGLKIEEVSFPDPAQVTEDWFPMSGVEMAAAHQDLFDDNRDDYGAALTNLIETGRKQSAATYHTQMMRRLAFRGQVDAFFAGCDILIVPTQPMLPPTVDAMNGLGAGQPDLGALIRFTALFDMTGNPTLILPCGFAASGMPLSFQLVGRHFEEDLLFDVGWLFQTVTDWHTRHPPLFS
jgi:amidase